MSEAGELPRSNPFGDASLHGQEGGGGSRFCGFLTDSFLTNSASSTAAVGSAFGGSFAAVSV